MTDCEQQLTRKSDAMATNSLKYCLAQSQLWKQKNPQSKGGRILTVTVSLKNCLAIGIACNPTALEQLFLGVRAIHLECKASGLRT